MTVSLMQPYLFPYVGYFQLIYASDKFIVYDLAQYIRKGWINRNRYLNQGNVTMFSVNVSKQNIYTKILDKKIAPHFACYKKKLLRAIEQSYSNSPFFKDFFHVVEKVFMLETDFISEMALSSIKMVLDYLDVKRPIEKSSDILSGWCGGESAMEKTVDIVSRVGCTVYLNMIGGKALYDPLFFQKNSMDLKFMVPRIVKYKQNSSDFYPCLSIIDMLMNMSPDEAVKLISNGEILQ